MKSKVDIWDRLSKLSLEERKARIDDAFSYIGTKYMLIEVATYRLLNQFQNWY